MKLSSLERFGLIVSLKDDPDNHKRGGRKKGTKNKPRDPDKGPLRRWGNPPPPKKEIKRPPAVYSNQSIYDKYGV